MPKKTKDDSFIEIESVYAFFKCKFSSNFLPEFPTSLESSASFKNGDLLVLF